MTVDPFLGSTLAILLLFVGKGVVARVALLRTYSIPEALVGGVICAAVVCALYYGAGIAVTFESGMRDVLLLYFFAAIGLNSNLRTLARGGRPFLVLTGLAVVFVLLQNGVAMGLAGAFGMDPRAGLMVGSVSLTGGVGTTLAWEPHFSNTLGIAGAGELGLAANMVGLIAACVVGGPIAGILMRRHRVRPSGDSVLEVGLPHGEERHGRLDYYGVLMALLWLNIAMMLGQGITRLAALTPLLLPSFVGCLLAGILLRAAADLLVRNGRGRLWNWPSMQPGLALISDISLGLFLTMALMGLQLWSLQGMFVFVLASLSVQILLALFSPRSSCSARWDATTKRA